MSDEKEKPEAEITELTDEVREELEDAIASRPHRAPKIMTEGIKPELDMTITEEKFLDGAVPEEIGRRFEQEPMLWKWWDSLTKKERETIYPLARGVIDADAWIGAVRSIYGEWMKERREQGLGYEKPPKSTHPGSDNVQ